MRTKIRLYWAKCGPRRGNFGDELSPLVVSTLTGVPVKYSSLDDSDLIACGSLAQEIPEYYEGDVWGTGCLYRDKFTVAPMAKVHALRGKLTAMRFSHVRHDIPLGDVGLVCSSLWPANRWITEDTQKHRLGLVPHYVDYDNAGVGEYLRKNSNVTVIDPCGNVLDVIRHIVHCDYIISSSLHGLVIADSYGIPNAWTAWSDKVVGGNFKFHDHVSIFGVNKIEPISFSCDDTTESLIGRIRWHTAPGLWQIQQDLLAAFPYERVN